MVSYSHNSNKKKMALIISNILFFPFIDFIGVQTCIGENQVFRKKFRFLVVFCGFSIGITGKKSPTKILLNFIKKNDFKNLFVQIHKKNTKEFFRNI